MKTEMIKIPLTVTQVDSAEWILGCPLFQSDPETISHDWDETEERCKEIALAASMARIDGRSLLIPNDYDVIEYMHYHATRLADMCGNEYLDDLISRGVSHSDAQRKANASVASAGSLANKVAKHL